MATNCQRSTMYGDVNCQATLGFLSNVFSLVMNLITLTTFRDACYKDLPNSVSQGGFTVDVDWSLDVSFAFIVVATFIKLSDALTHILLKTPEARWTKPPTEMKDVGDYLMLACQPKQEGMESA